MSFFQALQQMRHLTSLEFMVTSESNMQAFAESMPSLTGLRSLILSDQMNIPNTLSAIVERLTVLTQLTQLNLSCDLGGQSLRFPKGIVDLLLSSATIFPEDLTEELVDLTNLTSLDISSGEEMHLFHSESVTPFNFFEELGQLKTLVLCSVCLDGPFLDAFTALTGLTELRLCDCCGQMDPILLCQQLSLLSNLRVLEIPFSAELLIDSEAGVPQGCLSKLRTITSPLACTIDSGTYSAMVKAFPCLRNVR